MAAGLMDCRDVSHTPLARLQTSCRLSGCPSVGLSFSIEHKA